MKRVAKWLGWTFAVVMGLAVLGSLSGNTPTPADEYQAVLAGVRQQVAARLKDSESARWGRIWSPDTAVVCGFVNAKNSLGAYNGEELFWGMGTLVYFDRDLKDLTDAEKALPLEMRQRCEGG